jgi:hypothetical protein
VSGQALGQFGPIAHGQQPAAGQHLIQHAQQGRGQLAHAGLGDAEAGGLVFLQGVALEVGEQKKQLEVATGQHGVGPFSVGGKLPPFPACASGDTAPKLGQSR